MGLDIGHAFGIKTGPVLDPVVPRHTVFGNVEWQIADIVARQPRKEARKTLGINFPAHLSFGVLAFNLGNLRPRPSTMPDQTPGVVVDAQPIDRCADALKVVLPARRQMRGHTGEGLLGIGALGYGLNEPAISDGILPRGGGLVVGRGAGRLGGGKVQDDPQVTKTHCAKPLNGLGMGEEDMVHRAGCGADIAQSGGVMAEEM